MNVKANVGKTFFKLLQKHFPPTYPMYTISNKNKIKIRYSCFPNMGSIISSHNKHILNSNNTEDGCNCNNKDECPLENECLTPRIVYRADVTNNKTEEHKYYYGISDTPFKELSDGARLRRSLEVWQISSDLRNKRNGGSHEVDEIDNTFVYIYVHLLFIYLFVCFFFSLFVCLFI